MLHGYVGLQELSHLIPRIGDRSDRSPTRSPRHIITCGGCPLAQAELTQCIRMMSTGKTKKKRK